MYEVASRPPRRFPVLRDGWDSLDYFLSTTGLLSLYGVCIAFELTQLLSRRGSGSTPIALTCILLPQLIVATINRVRKWRAEEYVLTDDSLVFEQGYRQVRLPYENIALVHPIKICRISLTLKPAYRINFRQPIDGEPAADASPLDSETFLDELAARCPHLEREGVRMQPLVSSTGPK